VPKRQDLKKILLIGSGPIVIGQACEFDYSGTQACKALKEEGYSIVLVNNNPATIMTDPELADRTYLEPLTPDVLEKIIRRERPQALLPTMGGQTALNLAVTLAESLQNLKSVEDPCSRAGTSHVGQFGFSRFSAGKKISSAKSLSPQCAGMAAANCIWPLRPPFS